MGVSSSELKSIGVKEINSSCCNWGRNWPRGMVDASAGIESSVEDCSLLLNLLVDLTSSVARAPLISLLSGVVDLIFLVSSAVSSESDVISLGLATGRRRRTKV